MQEYGEKTTGFQEKWYEDRRVCIALASQIHDDKMDENDDGSIAWHGRSIMALL